VAGELDAKGRALTRLGRRTLLAAAACAGLSPAAAHAHVGSPDVVFDGMAGTNAVRVVVRPPPVVPGLAQVLVRVVSGSATAVTVQPVWWDAAQEGGAPPPEPAPSVEGERGLFVGYVWLMKPGSYTVRESVTAAGGSGEVQVPVAALATRRLEMQRGMGFVLAGLLALLVAGAVSIAGAAAREASLGGSEDMGSRRRSRGRLAMLVAAVAIAAALAGGWRWWGRVDARFRAELYRPMPVTARVQPDGATRLLSLALAGDADARRRWTPLALDHGKVMHLFMVREPGFDAFAHVHPIATSRAHDKFFASLPAIPSGRYRVYADVTHFDGLAQTLTDEVAVPEAGGGPGISGVEPDPDDAGGLSAPLAADGATGLRLADLGDGFTMERAGGALRAGTETALEFALHGPGGTVPEVQPYMGMRGHCLVVRDDGSVFIHLHPSGTISMAAQEMFAKRMARAGGHEGHGGPSAAPLVSFPYEFPRPGRYRVWVQVRLAGRIRTGVFDLLVG
jgi:hypothetical protein